MAACGHNAGAFAAQTAMAKDFDAMEDSNRSANASIHRLSDPARRLWLQGGLGALAATVLAGCTSAPAGAAPRLGFKAVPVSGADTVVVPEGYEAFALLPWGEPVGVPGHMPAWRMDAANSAAEQAVQLGMHHDGIHYFAIDGSSEHGLLVMNHEYTDDGLLHPGGMTPWTADKVHKAQAAHGVSVVEVRWLDGRWQAVRPSVHARRHTANTPFALAGPAAGHALMRTAADPSGRQVLGTLNNCASGKTPWGTYLSGEENWAFYFDGPDAPDADQRRWGLRRSGFFRWAEHDPRFDAARHPNEFHRFGWIVEIDPFDAEAVPRKRTALGRAAHEGAWVALTRDGRAVVYSGEDARFESIYKFVSHERMAPGGARANATLLDHGTLYVARFDADGSGRWLALRHGEGPLVAANGFADQGEVLIKARQASDWLGATKMDRPEWLAIDAQAATVYCTLTNNSRRGAPGQPAVDAANPRAHNVMGQIIQWREHGDLDATRFQWTHLLLAGDPANERDDARGNIHGDRFACPDGLTLDARGVLWVQTDMHASQMHRGELARMGNNQMLACDPASGEVRRFLTGPVNAEITGVALTPDARTMFINVQHPGESASDRSDPAQPAKYSSWPDHHAQGRPRSATVVIRRQDGGVIGS